ncbi:hypothetical protein DSO57_1032477 [Entomophthora muscae]|uniref:Uncharacterized protein n=1 Tax=Entomophthora muscae TaxID=34485 RepID=A0ACC2SPC5_9FUNG|nr:hypothetical protein DSO57_1032477 [Entomophthora muscae]
MVVGKTAGNSKPKICMLQGKKTTERKSWGEIAETPIQGAKFDKEFPPLLGKNKNKIKEKPDLSGRQTNLSSRQAPATPTQTPATPASHLLTQEGTRRPAVSLLPPSQAPASPPPTQPGTSRPAARLPASQPGPCHPPACLPARLPPAHRLAPWAPAGSLPPTQVPGPTLQPIRNPPGVQPIKQIP